MPASRPFTFVLLLALVLLLLRVAEAILFPENALSPGWMLILIGGMSAAWWVGHRSSGNAWSMVELQKQQITALRGRLGRVETELHNREKALTILEEKLRNALAEKEQLQGELQSQSQFLAQVAQEMRQPLRDILSALKSLQKDHTTTNIEIEQVAQRIELAASDVAGLTNEMLEYCSVEAGKVVFDERPFRIRPLLEQVSQHWQPALHEKSIPLQIEVHRRVPVSIVGESIRLRQILNNLFHWALRQKDLTGVHLHVAPQDLFLRNATLKFTLLMGCSSSLDDKATLADELRSVRRLVRLQNGRVEFRAEAQGKSLLVQIWLPFKLDSLFSDTEQEPLNNREHFLKGCSILVAEDNKVTQAVVSKILKDRGAHVCMASNGQEAVHLFEQQHFDAIIMDIHMPVMDGYEAVARIRQREGQQYHTPIVALTSSMMLTNKEKAMMYGMDEYVGKPFSIEDLLDKLYFLISEQRQLTKQASPK